MNYKTGWKRSFLPVILVIAMLSVFCFGSVTAFADEEFENESVLTDQITDSDDIDSAQSIEVPEDDGVETSGIVSDPALGDVPQEPADVIPSGLKPGWSFINGNWYYGDANGNAVTGWVKSGGKWYYMDPETAAMVTGWRTVDETWYFMNQSGVMQTGWLSYYGNWYLLSSWGAMYTGWVQSGGKWYYLDPESGVMASGWKLADGKWYYMNRSGVMQTGWLSYYGNWYLLADWGTMLTGWQNVRGTWYYLDPESGIMQTGWVQDGDLWYYMNKNGSMFTGWLNYYGNWYYLNWHGTEFTGLALWDSDYYYVKDGLYDKTFNGKSNIPGYSKEFDVKNGFVSGGVVPPSEAVSAKAEKVLNSLKARNLWEAYRWCIMYWEPGAGTNADMGIAYFANYGFEYGSGNCYVMASCFAALARQLGYEAYQMTGYVPSLNGGMTPHSWVEIDGKVYDPDFEAEGGWGGFGFNYGTPGTWQYANYYRMHN